MTDEQWAAANNIAWNDPTMRVECRKESASDWLLRVAPDAKRLNEESRAEIFNQSTREAGDANNAPASN